MLAMKRGRTWESVAISMIAAVILLSGSSPAACSPAAPPSALGSGWERSGVRRQMLAAVLTVPRGIADAAVSASTRQEKATRKRSRHNGDAPAHNGDEASETTPSELRVSEDSRGGKQEAPSTTVVVPRSIMHGAASPRPPPWRRILQARTRAFSGEEHAAKPSLLAPAAVGVAAGATAAAGYSGMVAKARRFHRSRGGGDKHLNFKEGKQRKEGSDLAMMSVFV